MRRNLLYLAFVLLAWAPEGASADAGLSIAASDVAEAAFLATSPPASATTDLASAMMAMGDVGMVLEMEEVAASEGAKVTLCVSTLLHVVGEAEGETDQTGATNDPAIRVALTPQPRVTVLTFFPMAQMWLLREAYIESERTFNQVQRAVDFPLWRVSHFPVFEHIEAPPPHTIREEAGFADTQHAINQSCACDDPVSPL
jgi:hypothetical protein